MASSDPQGSRLYEAEDAFTLERRTISRARIHEVMKQVRRVYALPQVPSLRYYRDAKDWRGAWMEVGGRRGSNPKLVINSHYRFGLVCLLHELAHLVNDYYFDVNGDWHGPQFCGIASWLYDDYEVLPSYAYEAILRKHGVKFWPAERCSPVRLKTLRRVEP